MIVGLSHHRENEVIHRFQDSLNLICDCGKYIKTLAHFVLHSLHYSNERSTFREYHRSILSKSDLQVTETLYGNNHSHNITNTLILNATIDFLIVSATRRRTVCHF